MVKFRVSNLVNMTFVGNPCCRPMVFIERQMLRIVSLYDHARSLHFTTLPSQRGLIEDVHSCRRQLSNNNVVRRDRPIDDV